MPQVFMTVGPKLHERFPKETICTLLNVTGQKLIAVVEEVFEIQGKHDVAFTAIKALHTINEAPIQIEIKYTVGENEYGKGELFDPPAEQRKLLAAKVKKLMDFTLPNFPASVWIRPQRESLFKGI
ncbi:MAG: hypothetical protein Q8N59_03430 [bacterium]|nr:hypothetical protein [bacterium]